MATTMDFIKGQDSVCIGSYGYFQVRVATPTETIIFYMYANHKDDIQGMSIKHSNWKKVSDWFDRRCEPIKTEWADKVKGFARCHLPQEILDFSAKLRTNYYEKADVPYPEYVQQDKIEQEIENTMVATMKEIKAEIQRRVEEGKEKYRQGKELYNAALYEKGEEFKRDLFEYYGVSDNPKRERCFEIAKENCSGGHLELSERFSDFVELIK